MKIIHTIAAAVCLTLLAQAATAQNITRRVNVEEDWGGGTMGWQSGGKLMLRYNVFESKGKIEVCVASTYTNNTPGAVNREALKRAKIMVNGKTIKRNLKFAKVHSSKYYKTNLVGLEAKCIRTKNAWPSGSFKSRAVFETGRYVVDK